jgi:predicted N-formylglutamate amidohydrolase
MAVAENLSRKLDAMLIAGTVSRLVYDCNRPPDAPDAMPEKSEIYAVPGNQQLTQADKAARIAAYYTPFKNGLSAAVRQKPAPVILTVHSFTPTYHGEPRSVEIGVVHDSDTRLADAMLDCVADHTKLDVRRNQPYGPEHGVTHTLKEHALPGGHLNVMLEIRNDLIATAAQQVAKADMLAAWIADAFSRTDAAGSVQCVA